MAWRLKDESAHDTVAHESGHGGRRGNGRTRGCAQYRNAISERLSKHSDASSSVNARSFSAAMRVERLWVRFPRDAGLLFSSMTLISTDANVSRR